MDLLGLGPEREKDQVWYELRDRLKPMERRRKLLPAESDLAVIKSEKKSPKPSLSRRVPRAR